MRVYQKLVVHKWRRFGKLDQQDLFYLGRQQWGLWERPNSLQARMMRFNFVVVKSRTATWSIEGRIRKYSLHIASPSSVSFAYGSPEPCSPLSSPRSNPTLALHFDKSSILPNAPPFHPWLLQCWSPTSFLSQAHSHPHED